MYHIQTTIFEDHLEQDWRSVDEYGLDLVGVLANFGGFPHHGSNISMISVFMYRADMEDIFDCTNGLDKVLLDCQVELK